MDRIYRGAWATIVALFGTSVHAGLPRVNPSIPTVQQTTRVIGKTKVDDCHAHAQAASQSVKVGDKSMDLSGSAALAAMHLLYPTPGILRVQRYAMLRVDGHDPLTLP